MSRVATRLSSNREGGHRLDRSSADSRERLSRTRIYAAALALIDKGGIGSLSMRSLARELGVKAGSLYYHFEGKAELLDGLADSLYAGLRDAVAVDKGWTENLRSVFQGLQQLVDAHPKVAPLLLRRLVGSPDAPYQARDLLRAVSDVDMDPQTSDVLVRNLVALLLGHCLMLTWQDDEGPYSLGATGHKRTSESRGGDGPTTAGPHASKPREGLSEGVMLSNGSLAALTLGLESLIRGFGGSPPSRPDGGSD